MSEAEALFERDIPEALREDAMMMMAIPQAAPINPRATTRRSSDAAWPLRDAQGRTWAERRNTELTSRAGTRPHGARGGNDALSNQGPGSAEQASPGE